MYLIVGLGNPGKEYENTRHNMGFRFIDAFAKEQGGLTFHEKFLGSYAECFYQGEKVILLKPLSYMNLSGKVVRSFVDFYQIDLDHLLVLCDDLDLPFSTYRLKKSGSSGGHNGLKDIEKFLGTKDYKRLKLGISHNRNYDTKDYVLGHFSKEETDILINMESIIVSIMKDFCLMDFESLMNRYNANGR